MDYNTKLEIAKGAIIRLAIRHGMTPHMIAFELDDPHEQALRDEYVALYEEGIKAEGRAHESETRIMFRTRSEVRAFCRENIEGIMGPGSPAEFIEMATEAVFEAILPNIMYGWRYTFDECEAFFGHACDKSRTTLEPTT